MADQEVSNQGPVTHELFGPLRVLGTALLRAICHFSTERTIYGIPYHW